MKKVTKPDSEKWNVFLPDSIMSTLQSTSVLEKCVSVSPSHTPHLALCKPHRPMCDRDEGEQGLPSLQVAYCEWMKSIISYLFRNVLSAPQRWENTEYHYYCVIVHICSHFLLYCKCFWLCELHNPVMYMIIIFLCTVHADIVCSGVLRMCVSENQWQKPKNCIPPVKRIH